MHHQQQQQSHPTTQHSSDTYISHGRQRGLHWQQHDSHGGSRSFESIDTDGSGSIDRDELLALLRTLQPKRYFGKAAVDESLCEMGADENAIISLPAFHEWWEASGKLTASEKLDKKWGSMQARFGGVMNQFASKLAADLTAAQTGRPSTLAAMQRAVSEATTVNADRPCGMGRWCTRTGSHQSS